MTRHLVPALALLALTACTRPEPPATTQLPRDVRPVHYDIALVPDAAALTFTGQVAIGVEVLAPTREITLHAADLRITRAGMTGTVEDEAGAGEPEVRMDAAAQTATLRFPREVPVGRFQLVIEYEGRIARQANGLFALDYATPAGPKRALFTWLAPADARRVFPCWDEPAHKATFALEVTAPTGQAAVSNMPVAGTEDLGGGRTRTRFAPTPRMSTYLLFLALGDLERATLAAAGTELGVVTRRGALKQARFVLESSAAVLAEYDRYFAIPYPLPKLDNVAAPGSSQKFVAMENWGAILTFESAILLDPAVATQADTQFAFTLAAHEIAHQWFGNLVTMAWWDDVWLNEGFASWMASRVTAQLHPEWSTALAAVGIRDRAMERDALATTHPVVQPIGSVEEMHQSFDAITYQKGESVIRMLEAFVGEDAWREGVRAYLRERPYGNATSADLWRAIEAAAGQPVAALARDFTEQPGVPLLRVERADCADGVTTLALAQGEFTRDRPGKAPLAWRVPVIAATPGGAPVRGLVTGGRARLAVTGCGPVVVNAGQAGYFRTLYAPGLFAGLASAFGALAAVDQLGLLADSWALGLAGLQPVTDALELARAAPVDADPQLWRRIALVLATLDGLYAGDPDRRAPYRRFAAGLLAPALEATGWTPRAGEPAALAVLRNDLLTTLGALGDAGVGAEARRRRAAAAADPAAMPAGVRTAILGVVARNADAADWESLLAAARAETSPLVRDQWYALLASAADPALARRALDLALTAEPGPTLGAEMVSTVAELHPALAFDFAVANRAAVLAMVDAPARSGYVARLAARSVDPAMPARIRADAAAHLPPEARGDAEAVAAAVADRARVRDQRLPEVDAWLAGLTAG
jgi:aminopeptidase N